MKENTPNGDCPSPRGNIFVTPKPQPALPPQLHKDSHSNYVEKEKISYVKVLFRITTPIKILKHKSFRRPALKRYEARKKKILVEKKNGKKNQFEIKIRIKTEETECTSRQ